MLNTSSILYPTDFSENARRAFQVAATIARKTGATLNVVHVFPEAEIADTTLREHVSARRKEEAERALEELLSSAPLQDLEVRPVLRGDEPLDEAILDEARKRSADLVVLGAYGRRGRRTYDIGATAQTVLRSASCPVLTVQNEFETGPENEILFRRVLIPTDFSAPAREAVNYAANLCEMFGSMAVVLHVVEEFVPPAIYGLDENPIQAMSRKIEDRARTEMERIAECFTSKGVQVENQIAGGHAPSEIVEFAERNDIDLIVIASRASKLERFVLGSVADKVVRAAPCSVLALKPV